MLTSLVGSHTVTHKDCNMKAVILYTGLLDSQSFQSLYGSRVKKYNLSHISFTATSLNAGKLNAAEKREFLASLNLEQYDYILCTDADFFKVLTNQKRAANSIGELFPYGQSSQASYLPSIQAYSFNPSKWSEAIDRVFETISNHTNGTYSAVGSDIVHSALYPDTLDGIKNVLKLLKTKPALTVDIETTGLQFGKDKLYSIGFAWDKHNGASFLVNDDVKPLLKNFFDTYTGKLIAHKSNFDFTILILELYGSFGKTAAHLQGLSTLLSNYEDTLFIAYFAINSCAGNNLSLKDLAQPFAGKWAIDVTDVTKQPVNELLRYNLIDCLSTWYVYDTYYPKMVQDEQVEIYNLFKEFQKDCIRMQLNGLPIDLPSVHALADNLEKEGKELEEELRNSPIVKEAEKLLAINRAKARNLKLKVKKVDANDCLEPFNFGSSKQLAVLFYEIMDLPILEYTDSKQPATGKKVIAKLLNHTTRDDYKDILKKVSALADVQKILSAFIPAFKSAQQGHLSGSFNLCGTVSGRLSSSDPNMQNLPATGSRFAKPVKKCFKAPKGWVFCGIDFASLEDVISAVTTKDPNKLRIYEEGYDSHSFRAYAYFKSKMPDIVEAHEKATTPEERVEVINSIQTKYKPLRQDSKPASFALTYGGTYKTLMSNCGFSEDLARQVEINYHKLYEVSDKWKEAHVEEAKKTGYVTCAFGLKLRTPLLQSWLKSKSNMVAAEERTAGNALGQSWCMLNNRAMREVMEQVDKDRKSLDILPVAQIHDACYYLVRENAETIHYLNKLVCKAASWQEDPLIAHDTVKIHGNLDLFIPDWSEGHTLATDATVEDIQAILDNAEENA